MTFEQLMLELLNRNCTNPSENGYVEHEIELHCVTATIVAKPTARDAEGLPSAYEIKSVTWRES